MLDDVQSPDLVSLVYSEQFDGLQEAEDGDAAHHVPAEDGRRPGRVPEQHPEGRVATGEDQTWRSC